MGSNDDPRAAHEGVVLHERGALGLLDRPPGPAYLLYSPGQIVIALLTGSPIAGALLMSLNYRRLGHAWLSRTTLAIGVGAMLIDLMFLAKIGTISGVTALIFAGSMHRAMRDGTLFDAHGERRGRRASSWGVLAIIVGALISWFVVGTIVGIVFAR